MAKYTNRLDEPLKKMSSLADQVPWQMYEHSEDFQYLCRIAPDKENERLVITDEIKENMNRSCIYIMVIEGRIFKIGTALRGIRGRISSYNSGRTKYRVRGTNSGANYWVLQSLLNLEKEAIFFAYYPPVQKCTIFGETLDEPFPSAKSVEGVIIRRFEDRYKKKPIGCTQG